MKDIIVDTDPGIDDLFAILMALGSERVRVRGLLSTCGNVGIEHTTRNLLSIATLAGRHDVPVFRGAERPLFGDLVSASHVHGEDGLGGAALPHPAIAPAGSALDYLTEAYAKPSDIVLVTLGPMTNVAQAIIARPEIAANIPRVVAMGGGFAGGNLTPHAEFNIYCDPLAAARVMSSGIPVTLIPLDATRRTVVTPARLAEIRSLPRIGELLAGTIEQYRGSGVLHDPNTIAWLQQPGIYTPRDGRISVTEQGEQAGRTVFEDGDGPHTVAFDANADGFFDALLSGLKRISQGS